MIAYSTAPVPKVINSIKILEHSCNTASRFNRSIQLTIPSIRTNWICCSLNNWLRISNVFVQHENTMLHVDQTSGKLRLTNVLTDLLEWEMLSRRFLVTTDSFIGYSFAAFVVSDTGSKKRRYRYVPNRNFWRWCTYQTEASVPS